jgi:hypothetical protein
MKIKNVKMIDESDWNELVEKTYGRTYDLQQQDGCKDRGIFNLTVPSKETNDFENDAVPEVANHSEMGVSFDAWLARDPKKPLPYEPEDFCLDLWWRRNFYPSIEMVANDLHKRELLEAGEYTINIDW